jgi:L-gulonate 5-dehydrogenase
MKSLVYMGKKRLDYIDMPDPVAADGEVLIRVASVGICGSDMHAYLGHDERRPAPLILGHEAAGTVVSGPDVGRRVTINPLVTCMICPACRTGRENLCPERQIISMPPREGAFADLLTMPERNLVTIPDHVSFDHAALAEPIACGWHAVKLAGRVLDRPLPEANIVVLGGGAIGVGAALSAKCIGASSITVIEANELRRNYINHRVGLVAVPPAEMPDDRPVDLVIDAVGIEATRRTASQCVRPGGVIVHIGLGQAEGGLDIRRMTLQEITFIGTYTYTMKDFRETAEAIFAGALGPLDWAEERPLEAGSQAFADLFDGKVDAPKIILKPSQS